MASSKSRDTTLLALAEVLAAINTALLAADADPTMTDDVRAELTSKFLFTAQAMVPVRGRTPRGKRSKAVVLQLIHEKLQPAPSLFVDLAISLALDLATPLRRNQAGA